VRAIGRYLGLDPRNVDRQPFPGPGLAVRIVGEVTPERCALLRLGPFTLYTKAFGLRLFLP